MTAAERQQVQRRWGVLFQDGALFSSMTVMENILVPLKEHTDLPPPLVDDIAKVKIAMAGLPAWAAGQYPSELSGSSEERRVGKERVRTCRLRGSRIHKKTTYIKPCS